VATTTHISAPSPTTSPLALWHLLSLDAPTVAALWTCFIARAAHASIPAALPAAMFLAVWLVYAADRLLDSRHLFSTDHRSLNELEARHLFHFRHRRVFLSIMPIAGLTVTALLPELLPATLSLYLMEASLLLGWFILVHTTHSRLPKELVVGLYFAAAAFTPTLVRRPAASAAMLLDAALFAMLCMLNCLFIHAWQRCVWSGQRTLAAATAIVCAVSAASALASAAPAVPAACALSAAALLAVNHFRCHLSRTHLRAAADFALLTPALLLPFLR
jgi:hypothetical protein